MFNYFYVVILISAVSGLKYPLEYQFDYVGQLSSGIPEIRTQVSSVGIKANLTIQVRSGEEAIAQLSDIEVGTYNDDVDCQLRNFVPIEYSPLEENAEELVKPFRFLLTEKEGYVMTVPEGELEWVTNLRKSVVEVFLIQPILANFNNKLLESQITEFAEENLPASFQIEEDSLIGRCLFQYTITKVPPKKIIKEDDLVGKLLLYDIQRNIGVTPDASSKDAPALDDVLWYATRSMDFSNCHGLVLAQRENVGATGLEGRSQNKFLTSRSSVGHYLLRGMPGNMRLDRAIIEGALLSNPLGIQAEKIQTLTNQTLLLRVVKLTGDELNLPDKTKNIRTWRFEVASPFFDPGPNHHQPWINFYGNLTEDPSILKPLMPESFLTGNLITKEKSQILRMKIYDLLSEAIDYLLSPAPVPSVYETPWDSAAGIVGFNMIAVTRALSGITVEEMAYISFTIFHGLDQKHHIMQMLFADACIASGDTVAVNQIFKLMMHKPFSKIPDFRAASLMMTIGHNLAAPTVLQLIYPYLTTLDIELRPLHTTATLLNIAVAANRLCFNPVTYNTSAPQQLFGRAMCDPESISNLYLPIMTNGIQNSKKNWQKSVYLHALANLKLPQSVNTFKSYATGQNTSDIVLRSTAIFAMSSQYQSSFARDLVFEALMPIMEDQGENLGLRQDAFMALLTWQPDAPWWHAMARLTWYEPYGPFAALIYFTIESMAKLEHPKYKSQSEIASMVLPLTKTFSPPFHYSFMRYHSNYLPDDKIQTLVEFSWVTSLENALPKDLFLFISSNFGGLDMELFQMDAVSKGIEKDIPSMVKYLKRILVPREPEEGEEEGVDANKKIVEDFLLDMKSQFDLLSEGDADKALHLYLRFFKNIQYFIPLTKDVIDGFMGKDGKKFVHLMAYNMPLNLNKYVVPVYNEYYLPTEIGLPLIHTDMASFLTFGEGHLLLTIKGDPENATIFDLMKAEQFTVEYVLNAKITSKVISKHTVLLPWSDMAVEAGVDHVKAINLPFEGVFTYKHYGMPTSFSLKASPIFDNQTQAVLYGHSIPYTAIGMMTPASNASNVTDFQQIAVERSRRPIVEEEYGLTTEFTGLKIELQWDSDGNFPLTKRRVLEFLRFPDKLLSILFHPTVKFWKGALIFDPAESETKNVVWELSLLNFFKKVGDPVPISHKNETSEVELRAEDTLTERIEKLKKKFKPTNFKSIRFQTMLTSDIQRIWDFSTTYKYTTHIEGLYVKYNMNFFLLFNRIPHWFERPFTICVGADLDVPSLPEITTFKARMEMKDLIVPKAMLVFNAGHTCRNNNFATLSTKMQISEERRQRLNEELETMCNVDVHDPMNSFRTVPTYDKLNAILNYNNRTWLLAKRIAWTIDQTVQGLMFPKATSFYNSEIDPKKIIVSAKRLLNDDGWGMRVNKPYEKTMASDVRVPFFLTQIMPYKGFFPINGSYFPTMPPSPSTNATKVGSQCLLQANKVKTFDGERLGVDLTSCWTLLSTATENYHWMLFSRLNPTNNRTEIKYADLDLKVIAYVAPHSAKVNGETVSSSKLSVKNRKGEPVFTVHRKKAGFIMSIANRLKVKVGSDITISLSPEYRGKLKGICGNWYSTKSWDTEGPRDCIYKDSQMLTASWTSSRDCSSSKLAALKEKIANSCKQNSNDKLGGRP